MVSKQKTLVFFIVSHKRYGGTYIKGTRKRPLNEGISLIEAVIITEII